MKRADLAEDHTHNGDDEQADDEAKPIAIGTTLTDRHLGYRSTKTENKHSHQHEHLETLQNIDNMSHFLTEDTEEGLAKVAERVAVGIHVHVNTPDVPARDGSHESENGVESATWSVASIGERPSEDWLAHSVRTKRSTVQSFFTCGEYSRGTARTQDVSGDQEEDGAPAGRPHGTGGLSPLEVGDGGEVVVGGHNVPVANDSVDLVDMALRESVLDDAAERPRSLAVDHVALVRPLFGSSQGCVVEVLLEEDFAVVVDLSGLDVELALLVATTLVTMIESKQSRVLLTHPRVTPIEGEVGKILASHVEWLWKASKLSRGIGKEARPQGGGGSEYVLELALQRVAPQLEAA